MYLPASINSSGDCSHNQYLRKDQPKALCILAPQILQNKKLVLATNFWGDLLLRKRHLLYYEKGFHHKAIMSSKTVTSQKCEAKYKKII